MKVFHISINNLIALEDILTYRDKKKLSQSKMASLLGITRELLNKVENKKLPISKSLMLSFDKLINSENFSQNSILKNNLLQEERVEYIRTSKTENELIPLYDVKASAGLGINN